MDDTSTLERLDAYLTELHAGRRPDRARWLADHPELAPHLDCLDRLDAMAIPATLAWTDDALASIQVPVDPAVELESFADGRYELLGVLGRGGMGVVYKALQTALNRTVAVKMILAGSMASPEQQRRFESEARAAARVQHPHVVTVFESGRANGLPYLVMPYVEGESLAARLRRGPLDVNEAVRLIAAVARAVAALHAAGIVHRDLKPSNVLLDRAGEPYVTDFGLAKLVEGDSQVTQSGTILGTPAYMAPEQAIGRAKDVGPTADIYALGAILYELLSGRPTVTTESPIDAILTVLEGEPPPPRSLNPKLPRSLERVVLQCLDKEPSRRFASATVLAEALECYLKGDPVPTRRTGPLEACWRWARREPALASRWSALTAFAGITSYNWWTMPDYRPTTLRVLALLWVWAVVSWACQRLLVRPGWAQWAAYLWGAADVAMLTTLQLMVAAWQTPLVVGYPFLVAASGLWGQVRTVWVATACTVAGYVWLAVLEQQQTQEAIRQPAYRHVIFVITLVVLGLLTAHQVQRLRSLSRYYEGK